MHTALSRALALSFLGPCLAPCASAQQFQQRRSKDYLPTLESQALTTGDVDRDGDPDLVVSWGLERLQLNDGRGRFTDVTAARMPGISTNTQELTLGDVDGDSDLDLVVGTATRERLYLNDGTGAFTDATGQLPLLGNQTEAVLLADLDGDADLDLVLGNTVTATPGATVPNKLCLNDGTGTFTDVTAGRLPLTTDNTYAVAAGDVDRDGDLDLVMGNLFQSRLYLNDGTARFTDATATRMPIASFATSAVSLGDVDRDGDLDLVIVDSLLGSDRLYLNDGTGRFTDVSAARMPGIALRTEALDLGDVDRDSDLDILLGCNGQERLYLNDGTGRFVDATAQRLPALADGTTSLDLVDVDADADLDCILGGPEEGRLLLNDGAGVFVEAIPACWPRIVGDNEAIVLADVDGDADLDVLIGNHIFGSQEQLYRNDGRGCFTDATARLPVAADETRALAVGDVDRDGDVDLVVGNGRGGYTPQGRQSKLLLNDGTGTFRDATADRMPARLDSTLALALGDLDGDLDLDLVVGNGVLGVYTSAGVQNRLYLNDGTGAFLDATAERMPPAALVTTSLALGDVDADGDLDLATGDLLSGLGGYGVGPARNSLYLNDGNAGFTDVTAARMPAIQNETYGLAFGDVDADADVDLVIATRGQDRLYLNDGAGAFTDATAARLPPRAGYKTAVALGDIDSDGDLDIVFGWRGPGTQPTLMLLNDGNAHFSDVTTTRIRFSRTMQTSDVALGDVDGDGDLDLVLGCSDVFGGAVLYTNLHRQLSTPVFPALAKQYDLEFHAAPGYSASSHTAVALLGFALWKVPIAIPPLGTSYVIPAFALLPAVSIPSATGVGVYRLRIPAAPTLHGLELFTQGVIVNDAVPGEVRFTNYAVDPILR